MVKRSLKKIHCMCHDKDKFCSEEVKKSFVELFFFVRLILVAHFFWLCSFFFRVHDSMVELQRLVKI